MLRVRQLDKQVAASPFSPFRVAATLEFSLHHLIQIPTTTTFFFPYPFSTHLEKHNTMATVLRRPMNPKAALPRASPRCARSLITTVSAQLLQTPRIQVSRPRGRFLSTTAFRFSQQQQSQVRPKSKVVESADAAVADVKSGSVLLSSGFGLCGIAGT